jgi:hypothetical protein
VVSEDAEWPSQSGSRRIAEQPAMALTRGRQRMPALARPSVMDTTNVLIAGVRPWSGAGVPTVARGAGQPSRSTGRSAFRFWIAGFTKLRRRLGVGEAMP